jgi:hypothetical protein
MHNALVVHLHHTPHVHAYYKDIISPNCVLNYARGESDTHENSFTAARYVCILYVFIYNCLFIRSNNLHTLC